MKHSNVENNIGVVILCGGRGVRLQPITDEIPKPLIYLKDQPMIKHILDIFNKWGLVNFYLCLGYKGFMIKDYFENKKLPYKINYDDIGEDASMMERVINVSKLIKGERFILCFGDVIADVNINKILDFHLAKKSLMTMTVLPFRSTFGIVKFNNDDQVIQFQEKPLLNEWINIGFMIVEKSILNLVTPRDTMVDFYQKAITTNQFYIFKHKGEHLTVNTKEEKIETELKLDNFYDILDMRNKK